VWVVCSPGLLAACWQDASSSSLLWVMALLEGHPEVLAKVRDEQRALRPDR
jgi:cytochrome P450